MNRSTPSGTAVLVAGVFVFALTCLAWLYAETHHVDSGPLFYVAGPVIGSLFLAAPIGKAANAAERAATQTNGGLEARMESALTRALAGRDAARTWQATTDRPAATDPAPPSPSTAGQAPPGVPSNP